MKKQPEHPEETELVLRLRLADEEAFRQVYDGHHRKLLWYCWKFTKSREIAEELVQDVFVKLWEQREKIHPDTSFGAYLRTLAKHRVLNHLKKEALRADFEKAKKQSAEETTESAERGLEYANYLELAQAAMLRLPPQRQLIFKMSRQDEMSNEEIAAALGLSKNTVKSQVGKALKFLRSSLGLSSSLSLLLFLLSFLFK